MLLLLLLLLLLTCMGVHGWQHTGQLWEAGYCNTVSCREAT
jgi:hypothetical protein